MVAFVGTLAPVSLHAQYRYNSPKGRVEVLGLERWTPQMLKDSVAKYSPGSQLHDAACMAVLRYKLGFRDALVMHHEYQRGPDDSTQYFLAIRVVEPRSARVAPFRTIRTDDYTSLLPDYGALVLPATDSTGGIWMERITYPLQFVDPEWRADVMAKGPQKLRDDDARLRAYLAAHATPRDRRIAMATLDSNGFWANRVAAAVTLASFSDDSVRYALVRAMRDPHETVRGAVETVLSGLPKARIDWRPVTNDLRALLGGTNVGAIDKVLAVLERTDIDSSMASALLDGNTVWLARLLDSESPSVSPNVIKFLRRIAPASGAGTDRAKWRAYLAERQRRGAPTPAKRATTASPTASARTSQR